MFEEKAGMVYRTVREVRGPLLLVEGVRGAKYNEVVEVKLADGTEIVGTVLDAFEDKAVIQVFGQTEGLSLDTAVRFTGDVMRIPLSDGDIRDRWNELPRQRPEASNILGSRSST